MIEPVRISVGGDAIRIENRHDFRDLSHLAFPWTCEEEGVVVAEGVLEDVTPGEVPLPKLPELPENAGETWLTVRAVLAAAEPWAPAGHEVAWGQGRVRPVPARPRRPRRDLDLDAFDPLTGRLRAVGGLAVAGPRLDLWRAPTDNDRGGPLPDERVWRGAGLDRLRHRLVGIERDGGDVVVRTRVAAAGHDRAMSATYRWSAEEGGRLRLELGVEPEGEWNFALPASACAWSCRPGSTGSPGTAAAPARRTPTAGRPPGSAGTR
ncbi:beta-galactosidase domain 4-containing protein [Thermocatellispora tengchongensis]|uniref:beta-galactosidase domain 4-containing protein n=1 Tax=Thermocatellispora tengchongensis TaxID=1073253 RepID=UPI003627DBB9